MVEPDAETFPTRRFDKFLHQVAARALFGSAVVGVFGFEMTEALVMLSGHYHVFLAGGFGEFGPLASRKRFGLELLREFFVFGNGDALVLHNPFVAPENAVQAPMNKHAELSFVPPLQPARPVALIASLWIGRSCEGNGRKRGYRERGRGQGSTRCDKPVATGNPVVILHVDLPSRNTLNVPA